MLLGTLIWGVIYGTVGMAVVWAWLENPFIALTLIALLGAIIVLYRLTQRKQTAEALKKVEKL